MNLKKENKKHSVWLSESAWTEVESRYRRDNCSTRNEFIEKAIRFKLSVDQNLMGNILAADIEIDPDQLRKARVRCVKEVKETNGEISFEDAVRYQQEAE